MVRRRVSEDDWDAEDEEDWDEEDEEDRDEEDEEDLDSELDDEDWQLEHREFERERW
jgi:hypothetical protein